MDLDGPAGKISGAAGIGAVAFRRLGEVYLATNFRIREGLDQRLANAATLIEPGAHWERYSQWRMIRLMLIRHLVPRHPHPPPPDWDPGVGIPLPQCGRGASRCQSSSPLPYHAGLSGENYCTIIKAILDCQYNLRPSWPDLIRPSTNASPLSQGVDGRVEHGHDETWLGL
jgi:hypothetical protein